MQFQKFQKLEFQVAEASFPALCKWKVKVSQKWPEITNLGLSFSEFASSGLVQNLCCKIVTIVKNFILDSSF